MALFFGSRGKQKEINEVNNDGPNREQLKRVKNKLGKTQTMPLIPQSKKDARRVMILTQIIQNRQNLGMIHRATIKELLILYDLHKKLDKVYGIISVGGEGIVISALDNLKRQTAVKIATYELEPDYLTAKHEYNNRFKRGTTLQSQLKRQIDLQGIQNFDIPAVYECGIEPCYLVMDYIHGLNAYEYALSKENLPNSLRTFYTILDIVEFYGYYGATHRDLKPTNILHGYVENANFGRSNDKLWLIDFLYAKQPNKVSSIHANLTTGFCCIGSAIRYCILNLLILYIILY